MSTNNKTLRNVTHDFLSILLAFDIKALDNFMEDPNGFRYETWFDYLRAIEREEI